MFPLKTFVSERRAPNLLPLEEMNDPVVEGDELDVTISVKNTGDKTGKQTIGLHVAEEEVYTTSIELEGGESAEAVVLGYKTEDGDTYELPITVALTARETARPLLHTSTRQPAFLSFEFWKTFYAFATASSRSHRWEILGRS